MLIKRYVDDAVYFLNVSLYMLSSARTIFSQQIDVFIQIKWLSEIRPCRSDLRSDKNCNGVALECVC